MVGSPGIRIAWSSIAFQVIAATIGGFRGQATQPRNSMEPDLRMSELISWLWCLSPMPELYDESVSADHDRTWAGLRLKAKLADFQYDM